MRLFKETQNLSGDILLKGLRQSSQKFWPKILTPYFFTVTSTYTSKDHAVKIFSKLHV